MDNWHNH